MAGAAREEGGSRGNQGFPRVVTGGTGRSPVLAVRWAAYRRVSMFEATWTIRPCDPRQAAALARELGLTETTSRVLLRRGCGDPSAAAAFLAGEAPGHDPFLLGDMGPACERIR